MSLKKLGRNTIIYALGNVCLRGASFFLIPIYTRALSVSDYGLFANLLLTIQLMVFIMSAGAQTSLVRYIREYERKNLIGELLGSTFFITIIGSILVTFISVTFLQSFFSQILHTEHVINLVLLTCIAATFQAFCIEMLAYYRAKNIAHKFVLTSAISVPLMLILNIVFLYYFEWRVQGALLAYITAYATLSGILFLNIIPKTGIGIANFLVIKLLRFGMPLSLSMSSWLIISSSGIYFLSYFSILENAAIYSLGQKFASISAMILLLPFQLAYEPIIFENIGHPDIREKISKILTYFLIVFAFVCFLTLVGTRVVLPLAAPPEYQPAYLIMIFLLPVVMFEGIYSIGGTLLQIVNKTNILGFSSLVFMGLCLMLNYFLIPQHGWMGAILSVIITYCAAALTILKIGMKAYPIPLDVKRILVSVTIFFIFLLTSYILANTNMIFFISFNFILLFIIILILYLIKYFTSDEKIFFKNIIYDIKVRVIS